MVPHQLRRHHRLHHQLLRQPSYSTDSAITTKYGIQNCSYVPPTTTVTAAQQAAMNWAKARAASTSCNGLCLSFVFDAYSAAGVNRDCCTNW